MECAGDQIIPPVEGIPSKERIVLGNVRRHGYWCIIFLAPADPSASIESAECRGRGACTWVARNIMVIGACLWQATAVKL